MSYIGQTLGQGKASRTLFTASGGETAVNVDGGYQIGQLDVFLNGVKLVDGEDYTASNGTSITGLSPALSSTDKIDFVALDTFSVSDGVPVSGGTFTGNVTVPTFSVVPGTTPSSPAEGQIYYNSVTKVIMVYNGSVWEQLSDQYMGGLVTTYSGYRVHTFLTSGTFTLTATKSLDYLIVGGGGGGMMNNISGGTGAGGMWVKTSDSKTAGSYPIVVGAGGSNTAGSGGHTSGARGHSSSAFEHAAAGGGAGRYRDDSDDNSQGASGGGGGSGWSPAHSNGSTGHGVVGSSGDTDSGTTFYGGDGGDGHGQGSHHANSGGGGGAGGNGGDANQTSGDGGRGGVGGAGLQNSFRTGSAQWYCAGGGGATYFGNVESGMMNGIGGSGVCEGAGAGYPPNSSAFSNASNSPHGVAYTGSGAGGLGQGGSGIVVIRYTI